MWPVVSHINTAYIAFLIPLIAYTQMGLLRLGAKVCLLFTSLFGITIVSITIVLVVSIIPWGS